MGEINILAVFLGAVAFFALGALWYGPLFGAAWKRETGWTTGDGMLELKSRNSTSLIMGLAFLFELLIALMLGHSVARSSGAPHVIMMMAVGFAAAIMVPAVGIHYLFQQRTGRLFAIDAGYFIVGMALMGGVFVLLG